MSSIYPTNHERKKKSRSTTGRRQTKRQVPACQQQHLVHFVERLLHFTLSFVFLFHLFLFLAISLGFHCHVFSSVALCSPCLSVLQPRLSVMIQNLFHSRHSLRASVRSVNLMDGIKINKNTFSSLTTVAVCVQPTTTISTHLKAVRMCMRRWRPR